MFQLLTGEGSKIKGEGPGFDREMFFEVLEAVDELQPGDTLRVKAEAAFGYYDFFSDGEYKATKKDVISLAAFSADLSGKIQEFGGFEKVKESGIGNLIKIIESVSKKTR